MGIFAKAGLIAWMTALPALGETYDFQVMCDGNPIGRHLVEVDRTGDITDVRVDIALDVVLAGLKLYRYHHSSHEQWRAGRLIFLTSQTDDDGTPLHLTAEATADGRLAVSSSDGDKILPADTIPTSYWNPDLLNRTTMLDSQNGRLLTVAVKPLPDGRYEFSGDLRLTIDYRQGRWSGLHFSYLGADFDYVPRPQLTVKAP